MQRLDVGLTTVGVSFADPQIPATFLLALHCAGVHPFPSQVRVRGPTPSTVGCFDHLQRLLAGFCEKLLPFALPHFPDIFGCFFFVRIVY